MASPNTAGVAALVLSARPGLTALDIKNAIMGSVDAKPDLAGKAVTGGRVNADRAVSRHARRRARERLAADHHRHHPPGRDAQHVHRPVEPAPAPRTRYVWQRSLDNGATWTTIPGATGSTYVPGASDINALLRSHGRRHQPVRRRQRHLDRGRPGHVGRAGHHRPRRDRRHAAPRPDAPGQRDLEPGRHDLHLPVGALRRRRRHLGRRSAPAPPATRSPPPSATREVRVTVTATNAYGQADGDQRPGRPDRVRPAGQHRRADDQRHQPQRTSTLTATPGTWSGSGNSVTLPVAARGRQRLGRDPERDDRPPTGSPRRTRALHVRVLVSMSNPDGSADRASAASAAPVAPFPPANTVAPVDHRHPAARQDLTADARHVDRPGQLLRATSGSATSARAGSPSTAPPAVLHADRRRTWTRSCACSSPPSNPDATIVEASDPTPAVLRRRTAQPGAARPSPAPRSAG